MRTRILAVLVGLLIPMLVAPRAEALPSEASPPPGANNWACRPSAAHPNPVVLVHGLSANMMLNWSYLSPELAKRGYCVFALTYGLDPRLALLGAPGGVIPIEQSAVELGAFVDKVLRTTGADKVDLVGHSEGTYMPQYWLKFLGGAVKTDKYVAITPLYGGTNPAGVAGLRDAGAQLGLSTAVIDLLAALCGSCPQLLTGSPMQKMLTAGGAAAPGVKYTTLMTKYDELVVPYTSGYLPGAVNNFVIQDLCPLDPVEHALIAFDPLTLQVTLNALDPANARPIMCYQLPYLPSQTVIAPPANTAPRTTAPVRPAQSAPTSVVAPAAVPKAAVAPTAAAAPRTTSAKPGRTTAAARPAPVAATAQPRIEQVAAPAEEPYFTPLAWLAAAALLTTGLLGLRRRHP